MSRSAWVRLAIAVCSAGLCVPVSTGAASSASAGVAGGAAAPTAGSPWSPTQAALPGDAASNPQMNLVGVQCPDSNTCVVFGTYVATSGVKPYVFTRKSGVWTQVNAPLPADAAADPLYSASSLSCASSSFCVFVGTYMKMSGGTFPVADYWNGSSVTVGVIAPPSNAASDPQAAMGGISCVAVSNCWASGTYAGMGTRLGAIYWYQSTGWTSMEAPDPTGATTITDILSMKCLAPDICWAFGTFINSSGAQLPFTDYYNGSTWSASAQPMPGNAASNPFATALSLSCPVTSFCAGSGDYLDTSGHGQGVLWTGNLSTGVFSAVQAPMPSAAPMNPQAFMPSIFCPVSGTCAAVGLYIGSDGLPHSLGELFNGSTWTPSAPPPPPVPITSPPSGQLHNVSAAGSSSLSAVACPSSASCTAVGSYVDSSGNSQGLLLPGGSGGASLKAPLPSNAATNPGAALSSVACPAANGCVAAGSYNDMSGNTQGFVAAQTALGGAYTPISPVRVWDTRAGSAVQCTSPGGCALGPGGSANVQITGVGGIPASATGVVLNVTGIQPTQGTYLSVAPAGTSNLAATSNLNLTAGAIQANLATVALSSSGQVAVYNSVGTTNVALDAEGYFLPLASPPPVGSAGAFHAVAPQRVCDTRSSCGSGGATALGPGQSRAIQVAIASGGIPNDGTAAAAVFNLTAVIGSTGTYLTAYPPKTDGTCATPATSNLNVNGGAILPNRVMVPIGSSGAAQGKVCIYNAAGSINFIIDVNGWFGNGTETAPGALFFAAASPERLCDTRSGNATPCSGHSLGAGLALPIDGRGTAPGDPTSPVAAVLNTTAVQGTSNTFLSLFPDGNRPSPLTSDVNASAGQIVPNLVVVGLSSANEKLDVYNDQGTINFILDAEGWFA